MVNRFGPSFFEFGDDTTYPDLCGNFYFFFGEVPKKFSASWIEVDPLFLVDRN
jgi:hypothetical protein